MTAKLAKEFIKDARTSLKILEAYIDGKGGLSNYRDYIFRINNALIHIENHIYKSEQMEKEKSVEEKEK